MIDYDQLMNAVKDVLFEEDWDGYDLNTIVRNAQPCWDGTAVKVKSTEFEFIFDIVSYECMSVSCNDLTE